MSFADDFRAIVVPRLKETIRVQAFLLALDQDDGPDYSDAHHAVMAVARKFGALYLTGDLVAELDDWIGSELLKAWTQAETRVAATTEEADAKLTHDPVAHYRALAASCREPDRMQWVFASICPEYRAWLIASRASPEPVRAGG